MDPLLIICFVFLFIAAITFIGEEIMLLFIMVGVVVAVIVYNDLDYYKGCADGGSSYTNCFYERVLKPAKTETK